MSGMKTQELKREQHRLRTWIADLQSGMFINCVYCGHRYGPKDSTADAIPRAGETMADALKRHIEECPEHPMALLKRKEEVLLEGLRQVHAAVDVSDEEAEETDLDDAIERLARVAVLSGEALRDWLEVT